MNELIGFIAVAVLLVLGVRYVVRQMQKAAQEYRDAVIRDDVESTRGWLASQRKPPHG